jgi:hypothetical protein
MNEFLVYVVLSFGAVPSNGIFVKYDDGYRCVITKTSSVHTVECRKDVL